MARAKSKTTWKYDGFVAPLRGEKTWAEWIRFVGSARAVHQALSRGDLEVCEVIDGQAHRLREVSRQGVLFD